MGKKSARREQRIAAARARDEALAQPLVFELAHDGKLEAEAGTVRDEFGEIPGVQSIACGAPRRRGRRSLAMSLLALSLSQ